MPIDPTSRSAPSSARRDFSWTESATCCSTTSRSAPARDRATTRPGARCATRRGRPAGAADLRASSRRRSTRPTRRARPAGCDDRPGQGACTARRRSRCTGRCRRREGARPRPRSPTSGTRAGRRHLAGDDVSALDGAAAVDNTSIIFARGEGGCGGERGPSVAAEPPDRAPDDVMRHADRAAAGAALPAARRPQPAALRPGVRRRAGFPAPILHGLCTYGMVCKSVVDELLDGDVAESGPSSVRFAGVVFPGETLRTSVWRDGDPVAPSSPPSTSATMRRALSRRRRWRSRCEGPPKPAAEIDTWDDEADVVVVGFGAAGSSAAYEAASAGADVMVLDRAGAVRRCSRDVRRVRLPRRRHPDAAGGRGLRRLGREHARHSSPPRAARSPDEDEDRALLRAQPRTPRVAAGARASNSSAR